MRLTEKQKKIVEENFNKKWKDKRCPFCGGSNWALSDKIFEIREFSGGNLIIGQESAIFPIIALTCENCSNTVFLSAIKMDLLKKEEPKKNDKSKNKNK